jgi:hypothetical protein
VRRNSYALAALAAAALTGFEPARTTMIPTPADDLDVAGVVSEDGKKVLVTVPSSAAAGARLEKDRTLTDALAERELAGLLVRSLANIPLPEGGRAVVTAVPGGAPLLFDQLTSSPALLRDLGATLARIHGVDTQVAEAAGAESFTARAVRDHHAAQVAEAHERGELPTAVQQHWDRLLADEALWDFTPVLIHGDLSEEELFVRGDRVSGLRSLSSARIGDPAEDLSWLAATLDPPEFTALLAAYQQVRTDADAHLEDRARAVGEFAVVDWLLHGFEADDAEIVADARGMLSDLNEEIAQVAREEAESALADLQARGVQATEDAADEVRRPREYGLPADSEPATTEDTDSTQDVVYPDAVDPEAPDPEAPDTASPDTDTRDESFEDGDDVEDDAGTQWSPRSPA